MTEKKATTTVPLLVMAATDNVHSDEEREVEIGLMASVTRMSGEDNVRFVLLLCGSSYADHLRQ